MTTRSSTASPARTPRSGGWGSPSPRRTRTRSPRSRSQGRQRRMRHAHARDHRRRLLPPVQALFIYVNKAKAAENAAVSAYVTTTFAEGTIPRSSRPSYVNLTPEALAESRSAWEAAKTRSSSASATTSRGSGPLVYPEGPTRPSPPKRSSPPWRRQVRPSRPDIAAGQRSSAASRDDRPRPGPRRVAGHDPDQLVHHRDGPRRGDQLPVADRPRPAGSAPDGSRDAASSTSPPSCSVR